MARLTKVKRKWYEIPDDPDGAKIEIRHLKPGEVAKIDAEAMELTGRQQNGVMDTEFKLNFRKKQDLITQNCILDWRKFFDEKGNELKCNQVNKMKALDEFDGFYEFIEECRVDLDANVTRESEAAEGN